MATRTKAQARKPAPKPRAAGEKLTPPLKWAGGKRWLIPHIQAYWEKHSDRRLVEPFCGGLAVALGLTPGKALLNDINGPLMNFYAWLKKGLSNARLDMRNDPDVYYAHRERFNHLLMSGKGGNKQAAELFYYLNRTGYNGLCRFNSKGEFNVPFGRYKRINYTKNFSAYREIFEKWEFQCQDFASLPIKPGDFIYADPPYDVQFTKYAKEDFSWADQVRLAEFLSTHQGPVVLSNQATERIVRLYEETGFSLRFLEGPRRISCTGDRSPAREVLAVRGVGNEGEVGCAA